MQYNCEESGADKNASLASSRANLFTEGATLYSFFVISTHSQCKWQWRYRGIIFWRVQAVTQHRGADVAFCANKGLRRFAGIGTSQKIRPKGG